jgi:hypothetical protein
MRLVFALLFPELLELPSLTFQVRLIGINLSLLIGLLDFLSLELIADQSAGSESKRAADGSAGTGMPDGRPDNAADRSPTQRANAGALLARRQTSPGTAQS